MSKQIMYPRNYIHSPKWRALHASAFRTAHCLWNHCDDFGLIAIEPLDALRFYLESRSMREDHIARDISELRTAQLVYVFRQPKIGIVACLPDFPQANPKKFPAQSLFTPIPDEILFAEPDFADIVLRYHAKLGGPVSTPRPTGKPSVEQGISLWNSFAAQHGMPQASVTPARIAHWNARCREDVFDLPAIIKEAHESDWLMGKIPGRHQTCFKLDFDYLTDGPNNYVKILEGKYRTNRPGANQQGTGTTGGQTGKTRTTFVPDIERLRSLGTQAAGDKHRDL